MKEQKVYAGMKREHIFSGATILGAILILLSIFFPWFYFAGTAEYYWGKSVEVSGQISAIGIGTLDRTSAKVTMWSSSYWSTVNSDFWFGYLSVVGLILVSASILVFMKTYKAKISMPLVLIGGSIVVLASLIAMTTYYKPYIFNIFGQIDDLQIQSARLYATQATVNVAVGPWLSLVGGLIPIISMASAYYHKIRKD